MGELSLEGCWVLTEYPVGGRIFKVNVYGVFLGDENVLELVVVMVTQFCKYPRKL